MADVHVALDVAKAGKLPAVCAMTGDRADGAVPLRLDRSLLRWRSPTVRVPMSAAAFKRWSRRQSVMLKSRLAAIALVVAALAFSAKSPFVALAALVLAGGVMWVSLKAERSLAEHQPGLERQRDQLLLRGVHPAFAEATRTTS